MSQPTVMPRHAVPEPFTWNAPSVFPTLEAWQAEFQQVSSDLAALSRFKGHLGDSPAALASALHEIMEVRARADRVFVYAGLAYRVDTTDSAAAARMGQAQSLYGQALAAVSFVNPELLALDRETLQVWLGQEPALQIYAHFFDNLWRKQEHVRSPEVEEILGMLAEPFAGPELTMSMLTDADFQFPAAVATDGRSAEVTQGTIVRLMHDPDRELRRTAWEGYHDLYLSCKNALAANLATSIKQNVFQMRARRFDSSLEMALEENNLPGQVFHNTLDTFRRNLPIWHRYWAIRRKALKVEALHPYDVWAPLNHAEFEIPFERAVDWICEGLAPMGEEYVSLLRRGCLQERWVDAWPNQGKTAGAFSWGTYGTYPFIVMSYKDDIQSLSTLAHELGHSMHSYLSWQTQPYVYADYSLFAAEVASNFHQAMVRAHLLARNSDPDFQVRLIEEAMSNFHRYFFVMPTLARFELELHRRVERGEGLTAEGMMDLMADLFAEGFGGQMHLDRARLGIAWATYGHLYTDYYVFQYATGISGANALARRILSGAPGAVEAYLGFLKAGASKYPLDALKDAGVDLSQPQAMETAFQVLEGYVSRLEGVFG